MNVDDVRTKYQDWLDRNEQRLTVFRSRQFPDKEVMALLKEENVLIREFLKDLKAVTK